MKVIDEISESLQSKELRQYLRSLFIDTRLADEDLSIQVTREARGFDEALRVAEKHQAIFGAAIRGTFPELYELSIKIEDTDDPVERMALWAVHLDQLAG